jgi:DNA polymerase (family X)
MMTNREIAETLAQFADLLDIKGESGFRVSAYRRGADIIKRLDEPVQTLVAEGRLTAIKGIGKGLAANVSELLESGQLSELEELQDEIPATLLTVLAIPGIGPKSVGRFYRELGITNLEQLEHAVETSLIASLKGFGAKQVQRITEGIAFLRQRTGRVSVGTALPVARIISSALGESLGTRVEIGGSLRRRTETVGNIDLLVEGDSTTEIIEVLESQFGAEDCRDTGAGMCTAWLPRLCVIRIITSSPERWGTDLLWLTGSQGHLDRFFSDTDAGDSSEAAAYARYGLPWIEPELREDRGEIEAARSGVLPDLVSLEKIKGDLHLHSTWSDGRATISQLAQRAVELRYQYLSIADHSHALAIANGLDVSRLRAQAEEIAEVQTEFPELRLLRASEVEVKRDGSLDFEDEVLAELDLVVASLHSGRNMSSDELTDRLLMAIENPHVDIIAHPTGRIVEQRPPASYDWERVFEAAVRTHTALEINANPARLDLPEDLARQAVAAGALIAIDSDAHDLEGLEVMEYGVGIARRGWVESGSVVNTWDVDRLMNWLSR